MKRRLTKKVLKKALALAEVRTRATIPVEEAWDIVADHLIDEGAAFCAFVSENYVNKTVILHTSNNTILLESTPKGAGENVL